MVISILLTLLMIIPDIDFFFIKEKSSVLEKFKIFKTESKKQTRKVIKVGLIEMENIMADIQI